MTKWTKYQMPEDMTGKSFLDVGCWEGRECAEAVRRGAKRVVGVDLCTCPKLKTLVEEHGFEFLQMDVFSELFFSLGQFDVVLCSGVLYHVPNPISLLLRLRQVTGDLLILESALTSLDVPGQVMQFCPGKDFRNNYSMWWLPNEACLLAMLRECGFGDIEKIWRRVINDVQCICLKARPIGDLHYEKMLPRMKTRMSVFGGTRPRHKRKR